MLWEYCTSQADLTEDAFESACEIKHWLRGLVDSCVVGKATIGIAPKPEESPPQLWLLGYIPTESQGGKSARASEPRKTLTNRTIQSEAKSACEA
jgi:hypothetical protein